jgi:hypothetical protein
LADRALATYARFVVVYHWTLFAPDPPGTLNYLRRFARRRRRRRRPGFASRPTPRPALS